MDSFLVEVNDEPQRRRDLIALVRGVVPFAPHAPQPTDTTDQHCEYIDSDSPANSCETVEDALFAVDTLSGGITNQLYTVTFPVTSSESGRCGESAKVVVRVYGKETERLISRTSEAFWQTQRLATFGRASNALVYEYLEGYRALESEECVTHSARVAQAVAQLHHSAAGAALLTLPYATEALFVNTALEGWLSEAIGAGAAMKNAGDRELWGLYNLKSAVAPQCRWLLECLAVLSPFLAVAPCHNDLLSKNVMVRGAPPRFRAGCVMDAPVTVADPSSAEGGVESHSSNADYDVKLIDFEYMRRNYALYDIANHFNEMAGFECKWAEQYPSSEERFHFVFTYLTEIHSLQRGCTQCTGSGIEGFGRVEKCDVNQAVQLVEFLTLVSHVVWAVWAVVQGAHSSIIFDYLPYGLQRLARLNETAMETAQQTSDVLGVKLPPFPRSE